VADGPEAATWNPAGLARLDRPDFTYSRSELPAGIHEDFFALGVPAHFLRGTIALAATRLSQGSLDLVTNANQTVGSFSPHSEAYSLAYGHGFEDNDPSETTRGYFGDNWNMPNAERPLSEESEPWTGDISAGLALKIVNESLGTRQAATFAIDGGGMFRPASLPALTLAGALRNAGGRLHFISRSEPLPGEFAAAVAYEARLSDDWRLLPALEADLPYAGNPYAKLGLEASHPVSWGVSAAARIGYNSRMVPDLGALAGLTGGVGLRIGPFSFDFAIEPMALLGESFRLGAGWRF